MVITNPTSLIKTDRRSSFGGGAGRVLARFDVIVVAVVVGVAVSFAQGNIQFLAATVAIYGLFAMATNMLVGWLGIVTFGAAAYFGAGAYFVALMREFEIAPPLLILLAGLVGAVLALLFSAITIRVNGIALTMLTLVFGQILYQLLFSFSFLGGDDGIPGVPSGQLLGLRLARPEDFWIYAIVIVTLCVLLLKVVYRSSFGRSVLAVHDDPLRADSLGIPLKSTRVKVFVLAGFFSAIAGGLLAQQQGIVTSENLYWMTSGQVLIMCLIGGSGRFWGPLIGAAILLVLESQLFRGISYSALFVGLILLAVVMFFRGGVAGLPAQIRGWVHWFADRRDAKAKEGRS
ncbi:branched-chain amino acid ABC transporter permease [Microbacterium sp. UBA3394]|uniref:branched-chain amino acid ABC transporter permease n=1 Tax=Microbacterium sp. UBA3394 TaxID=1946945 RepID=UPI00257A96E5|nr:branched-chain amino acid ABC transporter permease [Microbacterium sp. UBA3394]|tara:strand:+ start:31796 stop:32833 length:1038 start_codon:yes stop_codon:yes gene_type:complete